MNLLNPGVEKIIIYSADNTYTLSGNDISPNSTLTRRQQTRTGSRGGYLPFLIEHNLELSISDTAIYEAIQGQRFNVFVEKFNGFYVWGVTERLIKEEDVLFDPESEEYPYIIKAKNISESPEIGQDGNLLGEFVDFDSNGVADGWSTTGGTSTSFLNGEQTAEVNIIKTIDFAYEASYSASINVVSLHPNADNVFRLRFRNGGTTVNTISTTVTSTGVKTLVGTNSSSAVDNIQVEFRADNITSASNFTVSQPKLTIS